jgi:uncharacterized repeat protein (TIGR01451 family)
VSMRSTMQQSAARRPRGRAVVAMVAVAAQLAAVVVVVGLVVTPVGAQGPGPVPFVTVYVPLSEGDYMTALRNGTGAPGSIGTTARTTISITAAAADSVIYYDHWENGFEPTINDPSATSGAGATLVWGDGNPANGDVTPFCPRCSGDVIPAGGVITLNNSVPPGSAGTPTETPGGISVSGTPLVRNPAQVYWDGRDKIASTRGLSVSQAGWGDADALASGAVSALDTSRWGTSFVVPVGEDSPSLVGNGSVAASPTEYTAVSVMAAEPGTVLNVDRDADGSVDVTSTIGEGETLFVEDILEGATIVASNPVQADFYVADVGATYEIGFIELLPASQATNSYLAPAAAYVGNFETVVYVYNPHSTILYVTRQAPSGSVVYSVPARGSRVFELPLGEAALLTADRNFTTAALIGGSSGDGTPSSSDNSSRFDWGYVPLPTAFLTPSVVVGWAPGSQDLSDLNASVVWITSEVATTLYVDFDGDPTTGADVTPNTGACNGTDRYDVAIPVAALSSTRIADQTSDGSPFNDGDMTGARITTCDFDQRIAAAYGEDPAASDTGQPGAQGAPAAFPGLDLGTTQFPATALLVQKTSAVVGDLDGDGLPDPGDTVEWTVSATDIGATALTNVVALDSLPAGVGYVGGTTTIDEGSGPVAISDDVNPATPFPLDEGGYGIGNLSIGGTVTFRFRTTIDQPFVASSPTITNVAQFTSDQADGSGAGGFDVQGAPELAVGKISDANLPVTPGDTLTYTIDVGNNSGTTLTDVNVTDQLPAGLTWQSTSVSRPIDQVAGTITDDLQSTGYAGGAGWPVGQNWTEVGDDNLPGSGQIRNAVDGATRAIRFGGVGSGTAPELNDAIGRVAGDLTAYDLVTLDFDYRCSGMEEGDDVEVQIRPDDQQPWRTLSRYSGTTDGGAIACNSAAYVPQSFTLDSAVDVGNATEVRFVVVDAFDSNSNDIFYADDITFTLIDRVADVVAGYAPLNLTGRTTVTRADDFGTTATYANSSGTAAWAANWVDNQDANPSAGQIQSVNDLGSRRIRFNGTPPLNRSINRVAGDLSAYSGGTLSFDRRCSSMEAGDAVSVEIRPTGGATAWQTLATFSGCDNAGYVSEAYSLGAGQLGTATQIRFRVSDAFNDSSDIFYFDNVVLAGFVEPVRPYLIPDLLPGETATVTIVTLVDDPIAPAIEDLSNTAHVCAPASSCIYPPDDPDPPTGDYEEEDDVSDCVICFDFGDAPDEYGSLLGSNGARALYWPSGVRLGSLLDREVNAYAAANRSSPATGDNVDNLDDEDGVVINGNASLAGGTTATVEITVGNAPFGTFVNGWFDFDNDGVFDADESIFDPAVFVSATNGMTAGGFAPGAGTYTVTINVPDFEDNGSNYAVNDLVYSRFRTSTFAPQVSSPVGLSLDGEVEDYSTVLGALPVELAYFHAKPAKNAVNVAWRTAQEVDNLGFNLVADLGGGQTQVLNAEIIPSLAPTSAVAQSYSARVSSLGSQLWLESVALDGTTERHGPFALGEVWGDPRPPAPVDWNEADRAVDANEAAPAPIKASASTTGPVADIEVTESGLYRFSQADLMAAGVDLSGIKKAHVALTLGGTPVPIQVGGKGSTVGPDTVITFWGDPVDTLYTGTAIYRLQVDRKLAARFGTDNTKPIAGGAIARVYDEVAEVEVQRGYSVTAPGDDPWYDQLISTRSTPRSISRTIDIANPANGHGGASIGVSVWGISKWPQEAEHHVRVAVNGLVVADQRFDDLEAPVIEGVIPDGLLAEGANTVTVTLVGDTGVPLDMVALDSITVTYKRQTAMRDGGLRFGAVGDTAEVIGLTSADATALRFDDGRPTVLKRAATVADGQGGFTMTLPVGGLADVAVVPAGMIRVPPIAPARTAAATLSGPADYLVISHGALLESVEPLVAHHRGQGRRVKVVDVADVFATFGHGMVDAQAIDAYVAEAKRALGVRWVLLVGADTYDYRDFDGDGSFSLMPSLYGEVGEGNVRYAPIDPAYADVDGDGVPDLSLGRLPARTPADLDAMVAKSLAYATSVANGPASVLLASDENDGIDYASVNDSIADSFRGYEVSRSDIDRQGLATARASLLDGLGAGPTITSYVGHSGPREWGPAGYFASRDVASLGNAARPTALVQYGCWNTYYVQPAADTMAHLMLMSAGGGAAAVLGGSTLTSAAGDLAFARLASARLGSGGGTIGEAILAAKHDLARANRGLAEIQLGWTMLGDPALPLPPAGATT